MTPARRDRTYREPWDAEKLRALRQHLGSTQQELANELGMRQQTVSEWETGVYQPRGSSVTLLGMIAEQAAFAYGDRDRDREEEEGGG